MKLTSPFNKFIDNVATRVARTAVGRLQKRGVFEEIGDISALVRALGEASGDAVTGVKVNEQEALTLSYAYSAIKVLAETVAHVPLELRQKQGHSSVPVTEHDLFDLIVNAPGPNYTSYNWRNALEGHRSGWGNCYAYIDRPSFGSATVNELKILSPANTQADIMKIPGTNDRAMIYRTMIDDVPRIVAANDVIHVPGLGFNGITGYSPVHMARVTLGHGMSMQRFGAQLFGRGAKPSVMFKTQSTNVTGAAEFQKEVEKNFAGQDNWNKTMVLPKGVEFEQVTLNPGDAQWLQSRQFNRTEVAGLWRVPPHFIGDLDKNTFTNANQMDLSFVKHTMVPIFVSWESELNRKLLTSQERAAGLHFKFDVQGILRGDPETRAKFNESAIKNGYMKPLHAAEREGLPTDDEVLDTYYMPINSVPAGTDLSNMRPSESNNLNPVRSDAVRRISKAATNAVRRCTNEDVGKNADILQKLTRTVETVITPYCEVIGRDAEPFLKRLNTFILVRMKNDVADALPYLSRDYIENLLIEVYTDEEDESED